MNTSKENALQKIQSWFSALLCRTISQEKKKSLKEKDKQCYQVVEDLVMSIFSVFLFNFV